MPFLTRRSAFALAALGTVATAVVAGAVWSGVYDIGADTPHTRPVFTLLEAVRERSIAVRSAKLEPPDLTDPARIRHGAGNYAHMCASCHRVPGGGDTELSRGLYPVPPDLTREVVDPRAAYWVIAHGIKGSGMPAWGRSMDEESMWSLAAFVQALPKLDAAGYAELVAASGGHHHGSGLAGGADAAPAAGNAAPATTTHLHPDGKAHEHAAAPAPTPAPAPPATTTHLHADGKAHEHAAPVQPEPQAPPAEPAKAEETPPAEEHDHGAHEHPLP